MGVFYFTPTAGYLLVVLSVIMQSGIEKNSVMCYNNIVKPKQTPMSNRLKKLAVGSALVAGGGIIAQNALEATADTFKNQTVSESIYDLGQMMQLEDPIMTGEVMGEVSQKDKERLVYASVAAGGLLVAAAGVKLSIDAVRGNRQEEHP